MLSLTLVALLLATTASPVLGAWDCTGLSLGAAAFDLSKLAGLHEWEQQTSTPPTVTKTHYQLSLCAPLPDSSTSSPDDDCPAGTRLCVKTFSQRSGLEDRLLSVVPIAGDIGSGTLGQKAVELEEGVKPSEAWLLELGGGTYNGVEQKARIEMRCDTTAKETAPTVKDYDSKTGVLNLKWATLAACPLGSDGGSPTSPDPKEPEKEPDSKPDKPDEEEKSGGGLFSWFFTVLFLGIIAYFALATWNNYNQFGATGWDAIPHRDFLRDLPYVVVDLFKGRGGGRSGYSSLG